MPYGELALPCVGPWGRDGPGPRSHTGSAEPPSPREGDRLRSGPTVGPRRAAGATPRGPTPPVTAHALGQTLRLAGPLLQIVALIGLFRPGIGPALRTACYAAFLGGFVLVLAGVALARLPRRERPKPPDPDRILD